MIGTDRLTPYLSHVLAEVDVPGLPGRYSGKVRENFDLADGRRVIVATDRLSAFDIALAAIPFKGRVLTQTARHWFEATADIVPNHVLTYPDPNVVVARRVKILPVEIIVRGYLAGSTSTSILPMYKAGARELYGHRLPDGLRDNAVLPHPIITPTTKAGHGEHDMPLTAAEILDRGLLTEARWREVSAVALALFARGQAMTAERGLILADTKYEFGVDDEGRLVLADEIHTPDSSRYWLADSYPERLSTGAKPESFDKDHVRNWVVARCDPYNDPIPEIPADVVLETAAVYIHAFETITGQVFELPDPAETPLARIRAALSPYGAT